MEDYIFTITQSPALADVRVLSKTHFVNKCCIPNYRQRNRIRVGKPDTNFTKSLLGVGVKQFTIIFTPSDITQMQENGMLNYYPTEKWISVKYPMFSAAVYKKFGIKKER